MEVRVSAELLASQMEQLPWGPARQTLSDLEGYTAGTFDVLAAAWVDLGVRDEEGVPTEFEEPVVYLHLSAKHRPTGTNVLHRTVAAYAVPLLAEALRPQIEAASDRAWEQIGEWCDRFSKILAGLKVQRMRVLRLKENP